MGRQQNQTEGASFKLIFKKSEVNHIIDHAVLRFNAV